jgi:sulfite reductase beta subunit-like hemoprotein
MQWRLDKRHVSEEEQLKDNGLTLDFDEVARKGALGGGEKLLSKWYGIYGSRHPGAHMARVVIPGGVVTSSQVRRIVQVAEDYGQGKISITTRQCIQFHWLKAPALADMLRDLAKDNLSCFHGCGDVTRNVVACPLAETCQYKRINVLPYAKETAKALTAMRDLDNLPRKFKINFSGCGAGCGQPFINCIGAIAVTRKNESGEEETGFKVVIGGGMGWEAFIGKELFAFVPPDRIAAVNRAIALLFRDNGDRRDRTQSRLKFVVEKKGIEFCREVVIDFLEKENVSLDGFVFTDAVEDLGVPYPDRPLLEPNPVGTDGLVTVRVMVPKGEVTHPQMKRMAQLTEEFGDKRLFFTQRQNIEIHGVKPEKVETLSGEIKKAGFATEGFFGLQDMVACVGSTYCPKAVTETRALFDILHPIVKNHKYSEIWDKAYINITGCPNSCSPYRIADIGFRGMRIREKIGSVEAYEIRIGGEHNRLGRLLGEYKLSDCARIVETILDTFLNERQGDETLAQCVNRVSAQEGVK